MTYKKNFNDTAVFRTKNVRLVINSSAHLLEESNKLSKSFIFVSENIHDLHLGSIIVVVNSCSAMKHKYNQTLKQILGENIKSLVRYDQSSKNSSSKFIGLKFISKSLASVQSNGKNGENVWLGSDLSQC